MDEQTRARMDDLLLMVTQQAGDGVNGLLASVFGFLQRRTDFFYEAEPGDKMGFPPQHAQALVNQHFQQYQQVHQQRFPPKEGTIERWKAYQEAEIAKAKAAKEAKENAGATVTEVVEEEKKQEKASEAQAVPKKAVEPKPVVQNVTEAAKEKKPIQVSEGVEAMQKMSTYNGEELENYSWAQTAFEVSCQIRVPDGTSSKDLDIKMQPKHLYVRIKSSNKVLIDGDLPEKVKVEDSFWCVEEKKFISITFEKAYEAIWKSLIKGDHEIDPKTVDNSKKVEEFDLETQGHLQQVFYEQDRKRRGLPTTQEEENQKRVAEALAKSGMDPSVMQPYDSNKYGKQVGGSGNGPAIPFRN